MKRIINIIIAILAIIIAIRLIAIALPFIFAVVLIIGLTGWGFYKYVTRKVIKKVNQYKEEMDRGYYYNSNINNDTKNNDKQKDDYVGPIIDVDYEEINKK